MFRQARTWCFVDRPVTGHTTTTQTSSTSIPMACWTYFPETFRLHGNVIADVRLLNLAHHCDGC